MRAQSRQRGIMAACAAALGAWLCFAADARAVELSPGVSELYTSVSIYPPTAGSFTVCYGFGCRRRHILDLGPGDKTALTRIMAAGKASAAAERVAVQKAVIWFDRRVGPVIGTDKRIANADIRHMADKQNFDCWDTTRNVTSLLLVMQEWGLLKHHEVGNPRYRGNPLALQTPNNTAVLQERATRSEWVVDLWTRGYAQAPDVKPADQWVKEN